MNMTIEQLYSAEQCESLTIKTIVNPPVLKFPALRWEYTHKRTQSFINFAAFITVNLAHTAYLSKQSCLLYATLCV